MISRLVAFDIETATSHGPPHVIELGAVRVVDGEIEDTFQSLVAPQVPIEPAVTEVHGLVDEDVRDAPPASEVVAEFLAWLGEDWLIAHNASFDARGIAFEARRAGLELPASPVLDSLPLARKLIPESPDHKLLTLAQTLDLEEDEHHRALPDAVWCWKVAEECLRRIGADAGRAELVNACGRGGSITLSGAYPEPRRLPQRMRALERACRDGENVRLVYGELGTETAHLAVRPRLLYQTRDKAYLEAECLRSGSLKTYRLDRVHKILPHA